MNRKPFHFKQFDIYHDRCSMKVGTDGVLLGAWAGLEDASSILDIGTGSGVIAIMAAQRNEQATIDAIEIEINAYKQTQENIGLCPWGNRILAHHCSVQQYAEKESKRYDHIVSNPPFFESGTKSVNATRNTARHTEQLSQDELLQAARQLLAPIGSFSLILPTAEGKNFIRKARQHHLFASRITSVKPKVDKPVERLLIELSLANQDLIENELIIQNEKRNDFTKSYIALTKEFYNIM